MAPTIESIDHVIAPELLTISETTRGIRNIITTVPGSTSPYVTQNLPTLRTGRLEAFFDTDEEAAVEAEAILAAGGTFTIVYAERPSWEFTFVLAPGSLVCALDDETRDHWTVSFEFQEVAS